MSARDASAPLAGLCIVDLTRLLPGPAATMHLADFGADVIKVEDTREGDYLRGLPPAVTVDGDAVNPAFDALNRGKRSIRLDLKHNAGREALLRLVDRADALVESFRPGVMHRLGLGWETLHARNPRLVLCSITGYGQSGPMAARAGHDLNYIALTGVLDQIRARDRDAAPAIPNLQLGDLLGGTLSALSALLIALLAAQRTGVGRHVDVAMTDGLLAHHLFPHADLDAGVVPQAGGTLLTGGAACYNVYRCADGRYLAVGALEPKFWQAFCETAGLAGLQCAHWAYGQRPGSPEARATIAQVAQRIGAEPLAHWCAKFAEVDCCVTPVLTPAEALAQPQVDARGLLRRRGRLTRVGPLARIGAAASDGRIDAPTAAAGAHTRAVLRELGYSEPQIEALLAQGVAREPAPR